MTKQKYFARRRRAAEAEKKTRLLSILNLCVSASLREFCSSFTPSDVRATLQAKCLPRELEFGVLQYRAVEPQPHARRAGEVTPHPLRTSAPSPLGEGWLLNCPLRGESDFRSDRIGPSDPRNRGEFPDASGRVRGLFVRPRRFGCGSAALRACRLGKIGCVNGGSLPVTLSGR
jgi:hypothetical protein